MRVIADGFLYLACPYSHPDPAVRRARFEIANQVAARLVSLGHQVFSPISMGHPISEAGAPYDWTAWHNVDMAVLRSPRCRGIVVLVLSGWTKSTGVQAEIATAKEQGMPVYYMEPDGLPEEAAA